LGNTNPPTKSFSLSGSTSSVSNHGENHQSNATVIITDLHDRLTDRRHSYSI